MLTTILVSLAEAQQASPTAAPVVQAVNQVASQIPDSLPVWAFVAVGLLGELILRVFPTAKPRSFLLMISDLFKAVSALFTKASGLLDQVVQNLKPDPSEKK